MELNGGATVRMTISDHHRIVEVVKDEWANKVFQGFDFTYFFGEVKLHEVLAHVFIFW